jgi:hypothetical protein
MKLYSQSDAAIIGGTLNYNSNSASQAGAFNGGHNLHELTLTGAASVSIPVFPSNCN